MRRVFVDAARPQRDAIQEAATWIRTGGVVALPTDTFYGIAADPFNRAAIRRVFEVKARDAERALPLIAADTTQIVAHMGRLPPLAAQLAERYWPGPLTLMLVAPAGLPSEVTGGTGRVGIRVPANDVARAVCLDVGRPVTATSANLSGQSPAADPDEVERALGNRIDLLLDTGRTEGGAPSTIVDVTRPEPRLVRAGAIAFDEIERCLRRG